MAIDTVVEEVADNLEEIAEATRRINTNSVGFFLGGVGVGFALGFYWGYKFNKESIKAEAFKKSEEEVQKIREVYQQKTVAATPKPSVAVIVKEKGYIGEGEEEPKRPLRPPVPGIASPPPVSAPPVVTYDGGKDKDRDWDWQVEVANRVEGEPHVIHQDEFMGNEKNYSKVAYTYFTVDDVLVDEDNRPLPHADLIVGQNNLRWGRGTEDIDTVFVRNDKYELDMEITRHSGSYEEEVLGLENNESG